MSFDTFELDHARSSETVTSGVRVRVTPCFMDRHSSPDEGRFIFGYHVRITNEGDSPAQLLERSWLITDADGNSQEVQGEGVIGLQPRLEVGESHEYTSFCPLGTRWGTMEGAYTMTRDDGTLFEAKIDRFYLVAEDRDVERARSGVWVGGSPL
jgi:ApaG protein